MFKLKGAGMKGESKARIQMALAFAFSDPHYSIGIARADHGKGE
jgi:hypothetical protein